MSEQKQRVYEFGPFRLDAGEHLLWRAAESVPLTPKAFDLLLVLVAGRGHVFSKEELLEKVWPDSFVDENNLAQNVSLIRKVLGDGPESRYIETLPRRGYRFVAEVNHVVAPALSGEAMTEQLGDALIISRTRTHLIQHEEVEQTTPADMLALPDAAHTNPVIPAAYDDSVAARVLPARIRQPFTGRAVALTIVGLTAVTALGVWLWLARGVSQPGSVAEVKTLAILPFKELGAGDSTTEQAAIDYLGLGLADALITKFGNMRRIVARPTSAVRRYALEPADPIRAGRELGVEAVLTGNIQRTGERLRLTVQLLRVADGAPLWGETFNERFTDIFAMQDSISERVAAALIPQLSGAERARLKKRYTENIEAYRLYLMGVNEWNKFTPDGVQKSLDYYNQAIAIDPTYALAYTGLSNSYGLLGHNGGITPRASEQKARWAAEQALALDDTLAEAHYALAAVSLFDDWDWAATTREVERAIALNPNSADFHALRAGYLEMLGRFDDALAELKQAQQLNPLSPFVRMETAQAFYFARRYDEAVAESRQVLALNPHFYLSYYSLGRALEQKGRYEEAIATYQQGIQMFGRDPITVSSLGHAYAIAGQRAKAQAELAELQAMMGRRYVPPYWLALIYAGLGDKEQTLNWLERAADDRFFLLIWLKHEPHFDVCHTEPRFAALLRRIGVE